MKSLSQLLVEVFKSRDDVYALGYYDGSNVSYSPKKEELTEQIAQRHLDGEIIVGTYHLSNANTVRWLGWDIDGASMEESKEQVKKIREVIKAFPHAVEYSGGKGYQILIFLHDPVPADFARSVVESVRVEAGLVKTGATHCECYPKQDKLTPNSPYGSLLKLPLGLHPRTHEWSRFVDADNGWESGEPLNAETVLTTRVTGDSLKLLLRSSSPEEHMIELLAPLWATGNRHDTALALSGFLANVGWGVEKVMEIVAGICDKAGDVEKSNRIGCVEDTFKRIAEGKTVAGYSTLADVLPGAVMRTLVELAIVSQAGPGVHRIDAIRLGEDPSYLKVRKAASTILLEMHSGGRFLKTDNSLYYLNSEKHHLIQMMNRAEADDEFLQLLHLRFGLNTSESFGRQVYQAVLLEAGREAEKVEVYRRSHWDGQRLYVCLGGPEVYVVTGEGIFRSYNGECGYIFESKREYVVLDLNLPRVKGIAWDILINDLSLSTSNEAPASPEEQREMLKAWVLNTFFLETSPTKPLLICLGTPGSGKTTAMRRILRVLEGWEEEVAEISTDKQDSLRASLTSHQVIVFDNLEKTASKWMIDMLNRAATGTKIELRRLFSTNSIEIYRPNCFVAMTAVNLPFSDEALYSRMLPLEFQRIDQLIPESMLQTELMENYEAIWIDLLYQLNDLIPTLRSYKPKPVSTRLSDYAMFCDILVKSGICDNSLLSGLGKLNKQQSFALASNSPFIEVLQYWLSTFPDQAKEEQTLSDILVVFKSLASNMKGIDWRWNTPQGLGRHVAVIEDQLVTLFGATIDEKYDTAKGRKVKTYKFDPS
jgi:hypothetical protein